MASSPAPSPSPLRPETTQGWDIVVTVIVVAGCLLCIFGNAVLINYRRWRPIATKGVLLTTLSSLGGMILVVSTIIVLRLFPRRKGLLSNCSLWTFWLWACFGFALWLNCLTVRMRQLYLVVVKKVHLERRDVNWVRFRLTILPLLVLLSPAVIISLCATILQALRYNPDIQNCTFRGGYTYKFAMPIFLLMPVYFIILLWYAFQLRNIMAQWNEFRQIRIGGIMSFFLFLLSLVTIQSNVYYKAPGRCFLTLAVAGAVFYYFWARNWEVIYQVLFNRTSYDQQFGRELNGFSQTQPRASDLETNAMMKLVLATTEEARHLHQEMAEYQSEVNLIKLQIQKQETTPPSPAPL